MLIPSDVLLCMDHCCLNCPYIWEHWWSSGHPEYEMPSLSWGLPLC